MIVNHVSRVMGERRVSIQELVRRSGISYSTAHDLYHARTTRIDFETLDRVCAALACGVGDLLEYRPSEAEG